MALGSFSSGEVITYLEMCTEENTSLQRGMNFRLHPQYSVVLMSQRPGAPYADRVEDGGATLIYEGHDAPQSRDGADPKRIDQPLGTASGRPTQNAHFRSAARAFQDGRGEPELVKVYEKVRQGIWVFNGFFRLTDSWEEDSGGRSVFKFRLELTRDSASPGPQLEQNRTRIIPSAVKQEVWKRDAGQCVECGATDELHFDHVIPYSAGGSSTTTENVQLLCARHNLAKRDRIQ